MAQFSAGRAACLAVGQRKRSFVRAIWWWYLKGFTRSAPSSSPRSRSLRSPPPSVRRSRSLLTTRLTDRQRTDTYWYDGRIWLRLWRGLTSDDGSGEMVVAGNSIDGRPVRY